eukprot:GHUV01012675.1.p1 GENE.GHUV01012675.1~~GHUV01012675.1.p1  ORF type:complete len:179 (+),score=37.74 GHUV01012675.1:287-823(+)
MQHSRSAVSVASVISVVASEPGETYSRHIVIGIDNSLNSQDAVQWAIKNIYNTGDKFHLVHVIPEPPTLHPWPGVYIPPDDALEREEFQEATTLVKEAFAPLVNAAKVPTDVHLIVAVDAPESIASLLWEKARDLAATCLVVASHGKSALQEFWAGSVTRNLLRKVSTPIVVYMPHKR